MYPVRLPSVAARRAMLLEDPYIRELLASRPELASVLDAYLWAYPRSPRHSRRALIGALAVIGSGLFVVARAARRR